MFIGGEEMIEIKDVSKTFYSKSASIKALKDCSLKINEGEIFGIIGLSGAKLTFGSITIQGMVLATIIAIIMSLAFKLFDKFNLLRKD